jgi:hypothetical protein
MARAQRGPITGPFSHSEPAPIAPYLGSPMLIQELIAYHRKRARISDLSTADRVEHARLRRRIGTAIALSLAHDIDAEHVAPIGRAGPPCRPGGWDRERYFARLSNDG